MSGLSWPDPVPPRRKSSETWAYIDELRNPLVSHDITVQLLTCMSCDLAALTPLVRTAVLQLLAQDPSCKKVLEPGAVL